MIVVSLQALWPGRAGRTGTSHAGAPPGTGPLAINDDAWMERLRSIVGTIHRGGAKACAQLGVNGPWAPGGPGTPADAISPSDTLLDPRICRPDARAFSFVTGGRPASIEELRLVQQEIGKAARRAIAAGFDAVQLQAHCGGLISQFLSPLTNRRTDAYGGSLANRARLLVECLAVVRAAASSGVPVLCRINGDDLMPGGMGPDAYRQLVPMLEEAGADALDVKPGWYESPQPVHDASVPPGAFAYVSASLRHVARVPISANTRITAPELAEAHHRARRRRLRLARGRPHRRPRVAAEGQGRARGGHPAVHGVYGVLERPRDQAPADRLSGQSARRPGVGERAAARELDGGDPVRLLSTPP